MTTYLGRRPNTLLDPLCAVGICLVNHFQRTNIYRSSSQMLPRGYIPKGRTGVEIIRQNVKITLADCIEQPAVTLCQLDTCETRPDHSRLIYTIATEYARGDRVKNMCEGR
jgi:hypothetical protein